jgi:hypothetical protein
MAKRPFMRIRRRRNRNSMETASKEGVGMNYNGLLVARFRASGIEKSAYWGPDNNLKISPEPPG